MNADKFLSICRSNIRSLTPEKLQHIEAALSNRYHVITLSETWFKNDVNLDDFALENYQIPFMKNKSDNSGYGGLLVWIMNGIYCKRVLTFERDYIEILWIEIKFKSELILIGNIYRPPNSLVNWWDQLQEVFNEIIEHINYKYILLTGDLNAHLTNPEGKCLLNLYHKIICIIM